MPRSTFNNWRVDPTTGIVLPYYNGSFFGSGGSFGPIWNPSFAAPGRIRYGHETTPFVPQYPQSLSFYGANPAVDTPDVSSGFPIADIWAEFPDEWGDAPVAPDDRANYQLRIRAGKHALASWTEKKLLDHLGGSDFAFDSKVNHRPHLTASNSGDYGTPELVQWTPFGVNGSSVFNINVYSTWRWVTGFYTTDGYSPVTGMNGHFLSLAGTPIAPQVYAYTNVVNNHALWGNTIFRDWGGNVAGGTYQIALTYVGSLTFDVSSHFEGIIAFWR